MWLELLAEYCAVSDAIAAAQPEQARLAGVRWNGGPTAPLCGHAGRRGQDTRENGRRWLYAVSHGNQGHCGRGGAWLSRPCCRSARRGAGVGCDRYFSSVGSFDKHRREGRCLTEEEMTARGMLVNARGYWVSSEFTRDVSSWGQA